MAGRSMEPLMETINGTVGKSFSSKIPLKKRVRISYAESEEESRASNYTDEIGELFQSPNEQQPGRLIKKLRKADETIQHENAMESTEEKFSMENDQEENTGHDTTTDATNTSDDSEIEMT